MKSVRFKEILLLALLIVVVLGGITYSLRATDRQPVADAQPSAIDEQPASITLSIVDLYEQEPVVITENETILQLLQRLDTTDDDLQLTYKAYGEMGVLIESMAGHNNGTDNKYWQYTVNGTTPLIGADQYQLKPADSVVWVFEKSEF